MANPQKFQISGYSQTDISKIEIHLKKLLKYLNTNKISIVGGLAIRYHLDKHGIDYPERPFNDLDLMAESASAVSPKVKNEFLIYHYHPEKDGSFYIVLIDPESKTKVDIFDYNPPLEYPKEVTLMGQTIKVRGLEDQLVKTVFDIQRISEQSRVDPKQFTDTVLLMKIADMNLADKIWKKRNFPKYPKNIIKAIDRAIKISEKHPEWVQFSPFKKPKPYVCPQCIDTPDFKVDDMKEIYKILGYVE